MISINWSTKVITIPKTFLTLVQTSPTEIYNLDLNTFRLSLKDIEDSDEGMPYPDTHKHNTEVTLGGLTYARVIEILDPYTITFEDGQYAVNLVGANSNVGDKVNVNQVSVRANNSAGLISSPEIQYASYDGGVTIDVVNGFNSSMYPYGTSAKPCKTLLNVSEIIRYRGFRKVYVIGDIDFVGIPDNVLVGYTFIGQHIRSSNFIISNVNFNNCEFLDCTISGTFSNNSFVDIHNSNIKDLYNITLQSYNCSLSGIIGLNDTEPSNFYSCVDGIPGSGTPVIQLNDCVNLGLWDWSGGIKLTNIISPNANVSLNMSSGRLIVDSTDITGKIIVRGIGSVDGKTGGTILDDGSTLSTSSISSSVWLSDITGITQSSAGSKVNTIDITTKNTIGVVLSK